MSGVVSEAFAAYTWRDDEPPKVASVVETLKVIDVFDQAVMLELTTVSVPPTMNLTQPVPLPPEQFAALDVVTVPKLVPVIVIESPLLPPSVKARVLFVKEVASGTPTAVVTLDEAL